MKYLSMLTALMLAATPVLAQQPCSDADFKTAMHAGENARTYQDAYAQYDLAEDVACTAVQKKQARQKKEQLFAKINRLREDAAQAEAKAREEAEKARRAQAEAEESTRQAQAERRKAEEALRELQHSRDSTRQARQEQQRLAAMVDANELGRFGDVKVVDKDYEKAIDFYKKALSVLRLVEPKDSLVLIKMDLLREKELRAYGLEQKLYLSTRLIAEGASLSMNPSTLSEAYQKYLDAWQVGIDSQNVIRGLANLESKFGRGLTPSKNLKGLQYYELYNRSAEANLILNNPDVGEKRLEYILDKYAPQKVDFIQNPRFQKIKRRSSSGVYYGYNNYVQAGVINGLFLGLQYSPSKSTHAGLEVEFFSSGVAKRENVQVLTHWSAGFYLARTFFTIKDKTWQNARLQFHGLIGILTGNAKIESPERRLVDVDTISALAGNISEVEPSKISFDQLTLNYVANWDDGLLKFSYKASESADYLQNVYLGLNVLAAPLRRNDITLFAGVRYYLVSNVTTTYAFKSGILQHFKEEYQLSPSDLEELEENLNAVGIDDNFKIKDYAKQYTSGLNLKLGFYYRF